MLWDIVGALVIVFFILPIVGYIIIAIIGVVINEFERTPGAFKSCLQGCGIVALILIAGLVLLIHNQNKQSQRVIQEFKAEQENKKVYMQSLRDANPGQYGYIIIQNNNGVFYAPTTTEGYINIYPTEPQCYRARSDYIKRYDLSLLDVTCELL